MSSNQDQGWEKFASERVPNLSEAVVGQVDNHAWMKEPAPSLSQADYIKAQIESHESNQAQSPRPTAKSNSCTKQGFSKS